MDAQDEKRLARLERYLQLAICLALIPILVSCVSEINDVGGGHDSNQEMAVIFFFHLFLVVPCLLGLFVFLRVKLEKYFLSKETIESPEQNSWGLRKARSLESFGPCIFSFQKTEEVSRYRNRRVVRGFSLSFDRETFTGMHTLCPCEHMAMGCPRAWYLQVHCI